MNYGEQWTRHRAIIHDLVSPKRVLSYRPLLETTAWFVTASSFISPRLSDLVLTFKLAWQVLRTTSHRWAGNWLEPYSRRIWGIHYAGFQILKRFPSFNMAENFQVCLRYWHSAWKRPVCKARRTYCAWYHWSAGSWGIHGWYLPNQ